jgi:hypothetical protein
MVNKALRSRGELTGVWLMPFISGLILLRKTRFWPENPQKYEKARREKIR